PSLFFHAPATPEISTLSLHDALPICSPTSRGYTHSWPRSSPLMATARLRRGSSRPSGGASPVLERLRRRRPVPQEIPSEPPVLRSEEHTSELQSRENLVCRLLLEKKK